MFIDNDYRHHFVGYQKSSFSKVQMVNDTEGTRRKVYDLMIQDVPVTLLYFAINMAIPSVHILPTLLATLLLKYIGKKNCLV